MFVERLHHRVDRFPDSIVLSKPSFDSIPIISLTANNTEEACSEGKLAGANGFVTKPFIKGELSNVFQVRNFQNPTRQMETSILSLNNPSRIILENHE